MCVVYSPMTRYSTAMRSVYTLVALLLAAPFAAPGARAQSSAAIAADAAISADFAADDGQSYFSQSWLTDTMEKRTAATIAEVPRVFYQYYVVPDNPTHNSALSRNQMYRDFASVGGKDVVKPLLWILNRRDIDEVSPGDTIVVPTQFSLDFRAYSPFPRYYPGAQNLNKVVILDKSIQAWGAYEHGELARWGIISTGAQSNRTPSGRFNVNWKEEERVSTLSPGYGSAAPGAELWTMYWVMNLHETRGIHMHQYALPTSGPASHGCIRMLDPDAQWLYHWTDGWQVENQRDPISSVGAKIVSEGTMVLIIGHDISEPPEPYAMRDRYPVLNMVSLPPDPYGVPAGSPQQEQFDRRRRAS